MKSGSGEVKGGGGVGRCHCIRHPAYNCHGEESAVAARPIDEKLPSTPIHNDIGVEGRRSFFLGGDRLT